MSLKVNFIYYLFIMQMQSIFAQKKERKKHYRQELEDKAMHLLVATHLKVKHPDMGGHERTRVCTELFPNTLELSSPATYWTSLWNKAEAMQGLLDEHELYILNK